MHCHSTASQESRLGVQRSLGLPECATPPHEVYELAKRRGMDFVTITDHDTIDGCLELADRPDCFVSEELTARFAGEPQAVHVLCYGITPGDHEWLQAHAGDVEACAAYLHENEITCALAHPFYHVDAPLTRRHRRRLAELFPIWEVRNGSRAAELNMPAVSPRRRPLPRRKSFCATFAAATPSPAVSRAAPPSGRMPRWRSPPVLSASTDGPGMRARPIPPPS
jgi:predicted metal-dependent phosphoesterase TrpH